MYERNKKWSKRKEQKIHNSVASEEVKKVLIVAVFNFL